MSQVVDENRKIQKLSTIGERQSVLTSREHPMEREVRLRIKEADARWHRIKELIFVGSAVVVILIACSVSVYLIVSESSTPSERQLGFFVIGQIIAILISVVVGKTVKWNK